MRNYYIFIVFLSILVISIIVGGFIIGGTPVSQRALALDVTRLSDFSSIKYKIDNYYLENKRLPVALSDLKDSLNTKDPETKVEYVYAPESDTTYKICAVFSAESDPNQPNYYVYSEIKSHKKGFDCIPYNVTSLSYPPAISIAPTLAPTSSPTPTPN